MKFLTKGQTLESLIPVLKSAKICPVFLVKKREFEQNSDEILEKIQKKFKNKKLIIRSSSKFEDTKNSSNAGAFLSLQNIDYSNFKKSIERVFLSYPKISPDDEILVQPMLENVSISGVAFSAEVSTLAPYYVINFSENGDTDSVTSGQSNNIKTYFRYRGSPNKAKFNFLEKVISLLEELEEIYSNSYLDVEFAISDKKLFLLQVRPIVVQNKTEETLILRNPLEKIYSRISSAMLSQPNILGKTTFYGVMPDWNPAEIIGKKPKRLAISLYRELITDSVWAYQRDNYGYRNLRSFPLLKSFLGVPFIDIRVSLNSFIPKDLDENISEKLVNYYLEKLSTSPSHHDKIEFEVVHSCYYLGLPKKLKRLKKFGFNENELKRIEFSLLNLTNNIIKNNGLFKSDVQKINVLEKKFKETKNSNLSKIEKIYWHLEYCKRYGTLPFAGIARAAFIAVQFLKSFVETALISKKEYQLFLLNLNTVSKELSSDLSLFSDKIISEKKFLEKYGHLRPGTYDITSERYEQAFKKYFHHFKKTKKDEKQEDFSFEKYFEKLESILPENGLQINAKSLILFIKNAIEWREKAKFVFTKVLSEVLSLIEDVGKNLGISTEDLAFLNISEIQNLYTTLDHRNLKEIFVYDIQKNKKFYEFTNQIQLPNIILSPHDIYDFFLEKEEPNYITLNSFSGEIIKESEIHMENDLSGKIVMIESADPGYDFLFTKNIGGLITKYGGANSHMAIRCAELNIPAVIGAGSQNFSTWAMAHSLKIDCSTKQVLTL
jgi:phosphoenolpyruvate synthase/pyruvate phosphate dikinase